MTIDLRWLLFLIPFVLPFAIAGTVSGVFALVGAELIQQNREALAILSLLFGSIGGVLIALEIFGDSKPALFKVW